MTVHSGAKTFQGLNPWPIRYQHVHGRQDALGFLVRRIHLVSLYLCFMRKIDQSMD